MAFPPARWTWLAWVALVPFALAAARRPATPLDYLAAYAGGSLYFLLGLDFLRTGDGAGWLTVSGPLVPLWLLVGFSAGLAWPAAWWCCRQLYHRGRLPLCVAVPLSWVAWEYVRDPICGGLIRGGFSLLQLGATQIDFVLLAQAADLGGVYVLSLLAAAAGGACVDLLLLGRRGEVPPPGRTVPAVAALATGLVLLATLAYGGWRLRHEPFRPGPVVAIFSTDLVHGDVDEVARDIRGVLQETAARGGPAGAERFEGADGIDLLAFSEASYKGPDLQRPPLPHQAEHLAELARACGSDLVVGALREQAAPPGTFNALAVFSSSEGYQGCYDKMYPMPFVEFAPDPWLLWLLTGSTSSPAMLNIAHGAKPALFRTIAGRHDQPYSFGVAICYDVCFPLVFSSVLRRDGTRPQADFFVNIGQENQEATLRLQPMLLDLVRFRAIETRRAVCRAIDGGYSAVIDSDGRVQACVDDPLRSPPPLICTVPIDDRRSLCVACNYRFPWLVVAALMLALMWSFWPSRPAGPASA